MAGAMPSQRTFAGGMAGTGETWILRDFRDFPNEWLTNTPARPMRRQQEEQP
jgi:hypothetical protein